MKERPSWDEYFMSMVYLVAAKSKDKKTHVGAVIIGPDKEIKSTGYNSFVRRLNDNVPERQESPEKYYWFEHAERNAIYNATLIGTSLKDCKMYTNGIPCADCARGIIQSGIREIIVDKTWNDQNPKKWFEHAERSLKMFEETGVEIRYWEGRLLDIEKFRRGEVVEDSEISLDSKKIIENKMENKLKIKIKKLRPDAIVPKYANPGDAGMDLYSVEDLILKSGERAGIKTGISAELPEGYVTLVWDKSGNALKSGIKTMAGVCDSGYRGEYIIVLINLSGKDFEIKKGQKIAQMLIQKIETPKVEVVEELSSTERGVGGFGSTGII